MRRRLEIPVPLRAQVDEEAVRPPSDDSEHFGSIHSSESQCNGIELELEANADLFEDPLAYADYGLGLHPDPRPIAGEGAAHLIVNSNAEVI